jgi:hypothetical protein
MGLLLKIAIHGKCVGFVQSPSFCVHRLCLGALEMNVGIS